MTAARAKQHGAVYVEAAIIMPIMILVTFFSAFFFLCAARQLSVQMLASEIAKDISLALRPASFTGIDYCISSCRSGQESSNPGSNTFTTLGELNLDTYVTTMYGTDGCWNTCAQNAYLLATSGTYKLQVSAKAYQPIEWYDDPINTSYNHLSPGDLFTVTLKYPLRGVWGGGIAMFGVVPDGKFLNATAVGALEKQ